MKCPKCKYTSFNNLASCKKCGHVFENSNAIAFDNSFSLPSGNNDLGRRGTAEEQPDVLETVTSIQESLDEIDADEHEDIGSIPQAQVAQAGGDAIHVQGAGAAVNEINEFPAHSEVDWEKSVSLSSDELSIDVDMSVEEEEEEKNIMFKLKDEKSDVADAGMTHIKKELGRVGEELREIEGEPAHPARSSDMTGDLSMVQKGGFLRRMGAYLIDGFVLYLVNFILIFVGTIAMGINASELEGGGIEQIRLLLPLYIFGIIVSIAYYTFFHGNTGQTPGKMICRLKVVRTNGEPLGYGKAFLRWIGYIVSWFAFALGFLWVIFDRQKQAWHDKIAGTYVLKL